MPRKIREMLKLLNEDGWLAVRQSGSHLVLKHSTKPGIVVIPIHAGKDLAPGTEASILKQAGLK